MHSREATADDILKVSLMHLKHELRTGAQIEDVGMFARMRGMARKFGAT